MDPLLEWLEWLASKELEYVREVCRGCRLCSRVCPVYRATGDEGLTPYYRLRAALRVVEGGRLGRDEYRALFTCTMCGLCSLACPYSVRIWLLVWRARSLLADRGLLPRGLREVREAAMRTGFSYSLDPRIADRLATRLREAGVKVDEPSAYMLVPSPLEATVLPRLLAAKTRILPGINVSSKCLDLGGNTFFDASSPRQGLSLLYRCIEEAERLGAKTMVVSECGSDTKMVGLLGRIVERLLGGPRIVHFYSIIGERVHTAGKGDVRILTSCNFCRFPGPCPYRIGRPPRDGPPVTGCCGGGGGLALSREPWAKAVRVSVARMRLRSLNARRIVVPCVKCMVTLEEAALYEGARVEIEAVSEVLAAKRT